MQTDILLIAETIENELTPLSVELVTFARKLFSKEPSRLLMVVPGQKVRQAAERAAENFGIPVLGLENDNLQYPNPPLLAAGLQPVIEETAPSHICLLHSTRGCQTATSLSVKTGAACITAVESIIQETGQPIFKRSLFNGKLVMSLAPATSQTVLTVLPGAFSQVEDEETPADAGEVEVRKMDIPSAGFTPKGMAEMEQSDNALEEADVIVSGGRGIGEEENIALIKDAAAIFSNGAVAGSRTIVDMGWLPYQRQVGETGKTVAPRLYMACGISGAHQHVVGMKNSQQIVAVNTDPQAVIFSVSDYGIVEDLKTFLPILVEKKKEMFDS